MTLYIDFYSYADVVSLCNNHFSFIMIFHVTVL